MLAFLDQLVGLVIRLLDWREARRKREALAPTFTFRITAIPGGDSRIPSEWTKMHEEGFFIARIRVKHAPADWTLRYIDAGSSAQIDIKLTDQNGYWVGGKRTNKVAFGRTKCSYLIKAHFHDYFDVLVKAVITSQATVRLKLGGTDGIERILEIPYSVPGWMESKKTQSPPHDGS